MGRFGLSKEEKKAEIYFLEKLLFFLFTLSVDVLYRVWQGTKQSKMINFDSLLTTSKARSIFDAAETSTKS